MNKQIKLIVSVLVIFTSLFAGFFAVATPASAMTCNSATITGTVITGTPPTHARFTYGTSYSTVANGGGTPTAVQVFSTNGTFPIEQFISGLTENTTYYYRLEVTNNFGTSNLNINNFTTPSCGNPIQTCQDTSATNYGGTLPCNYYQNNNIYPTVNLYANPSSINYGGSSVITWNSTNANYCSLSGINNGYYNNVNQSTSGSVNTGSLSATTTYNIVCTSSSGQQANASTTVYVNNYQNNYYQPVVAYQPINYQYNSLSVVTNQATQITNTSAQLNSLIGNANGGGTSTWFEWGRTINLGNETTITSVDSLPSVIHADTLSGLDAGTTYYFRAVAQNSYSKVVGSIMSFTTTGARNIHVINYVRNTSANGLVLMTSSVNRNQPIVPTIDNTRPHPGDEINYTLNYQNVGNASVTNLSLQIVLPGEVDYISSTPNNPSIFGNTLIFKLGTLKANDQGAVTVKVRVEDNAVPGTTLDFPATLSYINPSGQPQSVSANVSAQVWSPADNGTSLGAFVFGAGFLPGSVFGWLLLIVLVLLLILLVRYLMGSYDNRYFVRKDNNTFE
jgi:uncharacterized repeat protein (TIGR01451 family)